MMMFQISEKILLTIWIGGMWAIGYIVAPVLFKMLDKPVAGNVAGQLFSIINYVGLFCAVVFVILRFFNGGSCICFNLDLDILDINFISFACSGSTTKNFYEWEEDKDGLGKKWEKMKDPQTNKTSSKSVV